MCYDLLRFILCSYDLFSLVDHACRSDARSSPRLERASFSFRTPPPCPSSSVRYDRKIQLKKAPHYLHPFGSCLGYSGVAAQNLCGSSSRRAIDSGVAAQNLCGLSSRRAIDSRVAAQNLCGLSSRRAIDSGAAAQNLCGLSSRRAIDSGVAAQNLCGLSSRLCATNASHSSKKHPTICTHSAPASALLGGGRGVISHLSSLAAIPRLIHRISFELRS